MGSDGKLHVVKDGADSVLPFSKGETLSPITLKYFTANTSWTYTITEECYVQFISAVAGNSIYAYWGKLSINNIEVEKYNAESSNTSTGWAGGYSKIYRVKSGDVIKSEVVNSNFAYKMSLIKWD